MTSASPGPTADSEDGTARTRRLRGGIWSNAPALPAAAASLGLSAYQLSLPGVLLGVHGYSNGHGYDDGVYFGAALEFVHGVLPYRDFVLLHPPGIALLMTPTALLGDLIGSRSAFAVARVLTVLVAAAVVVVGANLARRHGRVATLVTGFAIACYPFAVSADQSVLLEPYLALFCLLALRAAFPDGNLGTARQLLVAGVYLGLAGSVKSWAVLPAAALVLYVLAVRRGLVARLLAGILIGFTTPSVVFFAAAPRAFVHDVVFAQSDRISLASIIRGHGNRILEITGLDGLSAIHPGPRTGTVTAIVLVVIVVVVLRWRRADLDPLDRFLPLGGAIVVIGMLAGNVFTPHDAYFALVTLAPLFGVTVGLCWSELARRWPRPALRLGAAGLSLLGFAFLLGQDCGEIRAYLSGTTDPGPALAAVVPAGSCVVTDQATNLVVAGRLIPARPGCPVILDWFGTWLADDPGYLPPRTGPSPGTLVATWSQALRHAQYVLLFDPHSEAFPRTPALQVAFDAYRPAYADTGTYLYCHAGAGTTPAAALALSQGQAYLSVGDDHAAVGAFDAALLAEPCAPAALSGLATATGAEGNASGAVLIGAEVHLLDPGYEPATAP